MNKKILIAIIIILTVVLIAGFFVFKYLSQIKGIDTQNSIGGANTESLTEQKSETGPKDKNNQTEISLPQGDGGLIICADRCGDGVCQNKEPTCKDNNPNCTCAENLQECPQDCK